MTATALDHLNRSLGLTGGAEIKTIEQSPVSPAKFLLTTTTGEVVSLSASDMRSPTRFADRVTEAVGKVAYPLDSPDMQRDMLNQVLRDHQQQGD